ncbi:hypothetical protein [Actinomadura roseirufa]|uniref:hypothetical protein n=1 Tax=Actinomadura roseirufa TaxID=2094049 RepID=UPI00104189FA|nr:hypothetical protein [Actinomadura roseirufa]
MNRLAGAAFAAAAAITTVAGCGLSFGATTDHENRAYRVADPITRLRLRGPAANVEITGADVRKVTVKERLDFTEHRRPLSQHGVSGGELSLSYRCPDRFIVGTRSCGVSYRIQVPRGTAVDVATRAGTVRISGLTAAVTTEVGAGTTRLTDVRGPLRLSAGTGAITGTGLRCASGDEVRVRARVGDVELSFAVPPGVVDTAAGSGTTRIRVPSGLPYAVRADADMGSERIGVRHDPAAPHRIHARSTTGDIAILPA